ncbi:hypothetical protein ACJIZ3_006682 [Penstemon smallii]|uniref:tRNA-5-taurinomethyluridine 2-sulfurtransferase n=1 Tax=Penstemon smallii TaxID=265156 RepID=A0ABD3S8U0_9LAMI
MDNEDLSIIYIRFLFTYHKSAKLSFYLLLLLFHFQMSRRIIICNFMFQVSYIIDEYRCGRTPNPDVLCNTRIKFGAFVDAYAIGGMEFDFIASGHYAKVLHPNSGGKEEPSTLVLSKDMVKDQTYFLSHLSQSQLKRLIFPLGCIPKEEVRKIAKIFELPNQDRKDSQGICFLGKVKFSEFVAKHIGEEEGVILEAETGDFLGKHRGFWFYTIGQRQGLRLPAGGPWYVVEKDINNNVIFVSRNYFSVDKKRCIFLVGSLRWFSDSPPIQGRSSNYNARYTVRHGPGFYSCDLAIQVDENGHEMAVVKLSKDDQGLAAGQFAAFYHESVCLGSGVILESWHDQGFPVCDRALEPVKIKVIAESRKEEVIRKDRQLTSVDSKMGSQSYYYALKWLLHLRDKFLQAF